MSKLVLAHGEALSNLPLFVAQAQGYFLEQGLNVEVPILNGTASTVALLRRGEAQIGTTGFTQPLSDVYAADPLKIIAGSGTGGMAVLVHPDAVSADPTSLRWGTFYEDPMEVLLHDVLHHYHCSWQGTFIHYFTTLPQAITALQRREVDACTFIEPVISQLEQQGFKLLCDAAEVWGPDYPDTVLVTRASFLQQHPDKVDAVIAAMMQAESLINRDPLRALASVAKYYPGFNPELLLQGLKRQPTQIDIRHLTDTITDRFQSLSAMGRLTAPATPSTVVNFSRLTARLADAANKKRATQY